MRATRALRIAFNGLYLRHEDVGISRYSSELLRRLADEDLSIDVYVTRTTDPDRANPSRSEQINLLVVEPRIRTGNQFIDDRLWELEVFSKTRGTKYDLLHSPYFACSPFVNPPQVVTIHDVIPEVFREYLPSLPRRLHWWYNVRRSAVLHGVMADSQYTRDRLVQQLHVPAGRTYVVPLGVAEQFTPVTDRRERERVQWKYGLPERFLLYIGGYDIRKRVETLLEAFASFVRKEGTSMFLVLAGQIPAPLLRLVPDYDEAIQRLGIAHAVVRTGRVEESDLPAVYSLATLFAYPSAHEGFGLPVLEAMACGVPVIACGSSSLPEIVSRKDLLFQDGNARQLESRIAILAGDLPLRQEISQWGREAASRFSWKKVAQETLQVYRTVVHSHRMEGSPGVELH